MAAENLKAFLQNSTQASSEHVLRQECNSVRCQVIAAQQKNMCFSAEQLFVVCNANSSLQSGEVEDFINEVFAPNPLAAKHLHHQVTLGLPCLTRLLSNWRSPQQ